jgi:pimeloyl-ACP methyl ester carboxylesterase
VMPAVARAGFRAVAPFMRGYHPTEAPETGAYDGDTLGRDVLALIEALGEQPAIVVGHDWGALAAYTAASLGPARVRLLITVGVPHPGSVLPAPAMLWAVRHFLVLRGKRAAERVRANNYEYIDRLWRRWSPAWRHMPAEETARVKQVFAQPGSVEAACGYYAALRPWVPASLRARIAVPTVAFAGMHDNVAARAYERARRCFAASYEVVKVPGGHFMHREHPTEFIAELMRRLQAARDATG